MMTTPESVGLTWMALLAWLVYATLCSARWLQKAPRSRLRFAKIFLFIVFGISGWTVFALFSTIVVSGAIPIEADTPATLRALRALEWRIRMLNLVALIAGFASILLSVLFHEALLAPIRALWGRIRRERNKIRIAAYLMIGLAGLAAASAWTWHRWSRDPFERWSYQLLHDPRPEVRNQAFNKIV